MSKNEGLVSWELAEIALYTLYTIEVRIKNGGITREGVKDLINHLQSIVSEYHGISIEDLQKRGEL